jgi:hypothetical protein
MVLAGAVMAAAQGVSWGLWYGAAFGIGRSAPAWVAALHRAESVQPSEVVAVMTEANRRRGRRLGVVVAAMSLMLIVAELTGVATDRIS